MAYDASAPPPPEFVVMGLAGYTTSPAIPTSPKFAPNGLDASEIVAVAALVTTYAVWLYRLLGSPTWA